MDNKTVLQLSLLSSLITLGSIIVGQAMPKPRRNPSQRARLSKEDAYLAAKKTPELIAIEQANQFLQEANEQLFDLPESLIDPERAVLDKVRKKRQYIKRKDYAYKNLAFLKGMNDLTPPKRKYKAQRTPRTFKIPYEIGGKLFYQYFKL
jgi:hypothetical protein